MPDDAQDAAAQIAHGLDYIKSQYGAQHQAARDEVTCAGGITLPTIGAGDGE